MPHFYFDTKDGGGPIRDDDGQDLPDREAARRQAMRALREMVRDVLPDGDRRDFVASIRDETGQVIYSAVLNLHGGWLD